MEAAGEEGNGSKRNDQHDLREETFDSMKMLNYVIVFV